MSGVNLSTLNAEDCLDVIHYHFEEDSMPHFDRETVIRSKMRVVIYKNMYDTRYPFEVADPEEGTGPGPGASDLAFDEPALPPEKMPLKPYIPPTNPEDLPALLGRPMGG